LWHQKGANPNLGYYWVWGHITCNYRADAPYEYVDGLGIVVFWQYWDWRTYTWRYPDEDSLYDLRSCAYQACVKLGSQVNNEVAHPRYGNLVCRRGYLVYSVWKHLIPPTISYHTRTSAGICK
jgi:hypothetical protein